MSYEVAQVEPEMASELTMPQMELLLGDERPKLDYSKPAFSYTAGRLWRDRADVAKAAIKLLAEPREVLPYRRIMKRLHMSYHLLRQLELSCSSKIADEKKTLGDLMYTATEAFAERAIELAPEMKSGKDAMIAVGIGAEKLMMFRGEAAQKIDLNVTMDIGAKMEKLTEALLASRAKRAAVVEITEDPNLKLQPPEVQA